MKTLEDVLEEIVPTPDPDFVADMEWRMRRGFPDPERNSRLARLALPALRPRAVAAVAASALLALLVTVSLLDGGEPATTPPELPAAQRGADAEIMSDSSGGAASVAAPSPPIPVPPPDG